ncbi:PDR/VanB family oxidoreductase [Aquipseudomonas ullengensis]|uniref:Oxidoreductase n=1 Tax=Aquipseudomonas ullengensis TaxID=2759166 RepID=A0A7W4Q8N9_9GAMM|nr:PDR/VanB family oxidoreductase [Pseudomonas ullengensis]MBB2493545.1 oxidoreductase [Pseudomonas ullengensis]
MITVTISAMRLEAREILSLELVRPNREPLPAFEAGAHIDLHLPDGQVRQYSLCNPPGECQRYCIAVLKDPASRGGSKCVHESLRVGQQLQISAPRNLFPLVQHSGRSLLFAGGIGITPILSMAQYLSQQGADFELHYCARSVERTAFIELLNQSAFAQQVHLHFDDGPEQQKLDASRLLSSPEPTEHLYVCGPNGFMAHILDSARAQGWEENQLHREYFSAPASASAGDGSFELRIHSSGQVLLVPPHSSALEVLEAAGFDIPVSCGQGICGTCLTGVLEGEPEHRDLFLSPAEQARNDQFTPCCSRAKSNCLVLDL